MSVQLIRRAAVRAVVVALAAATVALAPTGTASASSVSRPTSPSKAAAGTWPALNAASRTAATTRKAAVVASMTTATSQTVAEPDGTFRLEDNALPVRVREGGAWVPVNTALHRTPGGISTTATTMPLTLGSGGTTTLVTLPAGGGTLTLSWPRPLPVPQLSGATATYPDVWPGTDLRVTAADSGFTEQLVVRSRQAAANPALRHVTFGVTANGLSLENSADGGLTVRNAAGTSVLQSDPALMSDAGGHQASVRTAAAHGTIVLSPDVAFLRDPATSLPVTIDPDFHPTRTVWAKVFSGFPTQTYFNGGPDDAVAKVGDCYVPSGECNGLGVARTYFQYDVSSLHANGGLVKAAEFNVAQTFGSSCSGRAIELESTGSINTTTTWNKQPTGTVIGSINTGCEVATHGYNIWAMWSGGKVSQTGVTFMLRAGNEADQLSWRKFANNPSLIITYNRPPGAPTAMTVNGNACATSAGTQFISPTVGASGSTIKLSATASDPDGDNVSMTISWFNGATTLGSSHSAFLKTGTPYVVAIPATSLTDGEVINWRAQATDGTDVGPASGNCWFTIDRTGPSVSPSASSPDYPLTTDASCPLAPSGGVGVPSSFTFGPNSTTTTTPTTADIAGYLYDIDGRAPTKPAKTSTLGGSATVTITPDKSGKVILNVQSRDRAGNVSPIAAYCFQVAAGREAVHTWSLDGATNESAAPDHPTNGKPELDATMTGLGNGGAWTSGRIGGAALFNGTPNDYVQQTSTGLAVDTQQSFSVSAWVRLDKLGNFPTAVSIDGTAAPGFQLQAQPDGHWAFVMFASDTNGGGFNYRLPSKATITVGRWTQLIGVYDAVNQMMSLYVNGALDGQLAHDSVWTAHGPLTIGRSMFDGAASDPWTGAIDDVRLFDYPMKLSPNDDSDDSLTSAQNLANLPTQRQAWFNFEEGSGAVATDASGNMHPATLGGGAERVDPGDSSQGSDALRLDGLTSFAATSGPVVATQAGFTVSAWVKLDDLGTATGTILSEDGAQTSNFALQYRDDGGIPSIAMQIAGSDVAAPTETTVSGGGNALTPGVWTYVAATYDAATGTLDLDVGSSQVASTKVTDGWAATGPLAIGRSLVGGAPAQLFAGDVDNVEVSTGAQALPELLAASASPPSPQSAYSGELTRWTSQSSPTHITSSTGAVPAGFTFEGPAGALAPVGAADTTELYQCLGAETDEFTSSDPTCGGLVLLGPLGPVYRAAADTAGAVQFLRCTYVAAGATFHFDSISSTCEGQTVDVVLGYLRPLVTLVRYHNADTDRSWTSANAADLATGFVAQPDLGAPGEAAIVSTTKITGTTDLMSCRDTIGQYLSTDTTCGGDTVIGGTGFIWTAPPPDAFSAPLFTCVDDTTHQRFSSMDQQCEGLSSAPSVRLGWVEIAL